MHEKKLSLKTKITSQSRPGESNTNKLRPTVTKGTKIDLVSSRKNSSLSSSNV